MIDDCKTGGWSPDLKKRVDKEKHVLSNSGFLYFYDEKRRSYYAYDKNSLNNVIKSSFRKIYRKYCEI